MADQTQAELQALRQQMQRMQEEGQAARALIEQQQQQLRQAEAMFQQQLQQGTMLQQMLASQQQWFEQQKAAESERHEKLVEALGKRVGSSGGLVDSKGIGKPNAFKSEPKEWRTWSIKVENFVSGAFSWCRPVLTWVEWKSKFSQIFRSVVWPARCSPWLGMV